ncbi:TlpA family protein disulfide reductase [Pectobacterium cacticida]|uniref:TlpA family protein disulfide reductase n=1 Tax=Pectobacterium cacticida TaxID=69221 RepID=UPI003986E676
MSDTPLYIGDPVPAFPQLHFIKGSPFSAFEAGKIYVLECWATWCGPCVDSFPHISQLQEKYPDVTVLGAAIWEEDIEKVQAFVNEHNSEMQYTIAFNPAATGDDGEDIPTAWLRPTYMDGIPTAYVIDAQGRLAWFGHPMDLDEPLAALTSGSFDISKAADSYRRWVAESMIAEKTALKKQVRSCLSNDDLSGAIALYDKGFKENPPLEKELCLNKLELLLRSGDGLQALDYARYLVSNPHQSETELHDEVAYLILDSIEDNATMKGLDELLAYAEALLLNAEKQVLAQEQQDTVALCYITRALALIKLRHNNRQEADRYAKASLAYAHQAEFDEEMIQQILGQLLEDCRVDVPEPVSSPGRKVVCDGDQCWLE